MIGVSVQPGPGGSVEISVADNGPGISDTEKSKVVERFYRGDASRGTPGVGLGLSLAQAVAKLHGSSLELSDRNPGLRVVLTIPADAAPAPAAAVPAPSDPARLPGIAATSA
jgi:signal transduction histidine kinase